MKMLLVAVPPEFDAVRVYDVLVYGFTDTDPDGPTQPMPGLMVTLSAPETDQTKLAVSPLDIDPLSALK